MDIIIKKFDLCRDVQGIILSYIYDNLGYTRNELECIEKLKNSRRNIFMNNRIKVELGEWYRLKVSVSWLRCGGVYASWISSYYCPRQYESTLLHEVFSKKQLVVRA